MCVHAFIAYCDAALIGATRTLAETVLYSEDLNHGQDSEAVRAANPFFGQ